MPNIVLKIGLLALGILLTGCAAQQMDASSQSGQVREVQQESGKIVYWILPGPRQLDPAVFGSKDNPQMRAKPKIQEAERMVAAGKMPPSVPGLLKELPILVGVPVMARKEDENGNLWLKMPNLFSNKAEIVSGHFNATFTDVVKKDPAGPPGKTPDKATMEAFFSDPAGNEYRVVLDHVVKPPFPGYATEGGVMIDSFHHGASGTGSPLMPHVKTKAAFWGVGDVYVNGELTQPHRVMHLMTTEVVRNRDYELVFEKDLPLPPGERHIRNQETHTHLVVLPVKAGKKGPEFSPLQTAFRLPNGMPQPFMHIMFEQDEIVQ